MKRLRIKRGQIDLSDCEVIKVIIPVDSDQLGWIITTNKQAISFLIDNSQDCCESWGMLISEDKPEEFVGAALLGVSMVDTALNNFDVTDASDLDEGDAMFINIETSRGTFQMVAYNSHNGYYGHSVKIISNQITEEFLL